MNPDCDLSICGIARSLWRSISDRSSPIVQRLLASLRSSWRIQSPTRSADAKATIRVLKKICLLLLLLSCQRTPHGDEIVKMHTIDQRGMTVTIQSPDRLARYQRVDFEKPQPYEKVLRIFAENSDGRIRSCVTSYYPSSQIRQSLDVVDSRASGLYREWHPNGALKLEAQVIGGNNDIDPSSIASYIFDGVSRAWDEEGHLQVEMTYAHGVLHGPTTLSHATEHYKDGLLDQATYPLTSVENGTGHRTVFHDDGSYAFHSYAAGYPEGPVECFDAGGTLTHSYQIHNGVKHGNEIHHNPKYSIHWHEGEIHGLIRTWHANGQLESQREMSRNKKEGLSMAWYPDGNLLLIEEYCQDKLTRGEYYRRGSLAPISTVTDGKGTATLHDREGNPLRRIPYFDGIPGNL